ncbi:hypothetical protein FGADI_5358 [Fusarium gaditjirri]|uniref:Uncharacterized protein n=1 Tax=Fusarium gaditjirri TaxID=282569 RepID=A0A8H4WY77_9HYPO|nr:hypothetical protein FGADI_5358 [Fusarium gaditjirri]
MKITAFLASALVGIATAADTLYLVNSWRGNEISSGMAYYADGHDATGGTGGSRPNDYVDVTHGSHIIWEGQAVKGTFGTGVSFTSNIFADAASKHDRMHGLARAPMGTICITAGSALGLLSTIAGLLISGWDNYVR